MKTSPSENKAHTPNEFLQGMEQEFLREAPFLTQKGLKRLGVVDWGYTEDARAASFERFDQWVEEGGHGPLAYLADERKEKRRDLRNVFPEFQSALVFLFSYAEMKKSLDDFYRRRRGRNLFRLSSFVFSFGGEDYHRRLKEYLLLVARALGEAHPGIKAFLTLDVHPVLERDLAHRSGLGWFGRNSLLIHPEHGSFTLIGSLLLSERIKVKSDLPSLPMADHCGHCLACVEACPTGAIRPQSRTLDAAKCISTFTIEMFKAGTNPPEGYQSTQGEIFGCDICQDVCPWNGKKMRRLGEAPPVPLTSPVFSFFLGEGRDGEVIAKELQEMSGREFGRRFKNTSLERTGRQGLLKNIATWPRKDSGSENP